MSDIKTIISTIEKSVNGLSEAAKAKQAPLYKQLLQLVKGLETNGDNLVNSVKNFSTINKIKAALERAIVDKSYTEELKKFAQSYNDIAELSNQYFSKVASEFSPKKALKVIRQTAIETTLNNLTEAGLQVGVTNGLQKILVQNITQGGSYADMTEQLRNYMLTNNTGEGALERYVKTYATTAINQYSAEYNKSIADDLGLEWYMYDGSLLETSREFCKHAVKMKYIHVSEFPALLEGDFGSYGKVEVSDNTGLPAGMLPGTDKNNLVRRRGGYFCGHQMIAVSDVVVPEKRKQEVYATQAYKNWKLAN